MTFEPKLVREFAAVVKSPSVGFPPTFLTYFRQGEFSLLPKLKIDLSQVLHGEQEYEYLGSLKSSDPVDLVTELKSDATKKGATGGLRFLVFETTISQTGKTIAICRTTMIAKVKL